VERRNSSRWFPSVSPCDLIFRACGCRDIIEAEAAAFKKRRNDHFKSPRWTVVHVPLARQDALFRYSALDPPITSTVLGNKTISRPKKIEADRLPKGLRDFLVTCRRAAPNAMKVIKVRPGTILYRVCWLPIFRKNFRLLALSLSLGDAACESG
jgi:hypothetical protein